MNKHLFLVDGHYTYFFQRVVYIGVRNGCYEFRMLSGCRLLIDELHTGLIFRKSQ